MCIYRKTRTVTSKLQIAKYRIIARGSHTLSHFYLPGSTKKIIFTSRNQIMRNPDELRQNWPLVAAAIASIVIGGNKGCEYETLTPHSSGTVLISHSTDNSAFARLIAAGRKRLKQTLR